MKKRLFSIILIIACFAVALFPFVNSDDLVSASADSVSYNQLYRVDFNQKFNSASPNISTRSGISCTRNNNVFIFSGTATASAVFGLVYMPPIGHKVLYSPTINITENLPNWKISQNFMADIGEPLIREVSRTNCVLYAYFIAGWITDGLSFSLNIFDLTQMFGEGNEPTTVEEFRDMYPADYYDYTLSDWQVSVNLYETAYLGYTTPNSDAFLLPDDLISAYKDNSDILISVFYDNGSFTVFGIILLSLLCFCLFFTVLYIVKKIINRGE